MDIREYIQSGIIESYVLGLADAEEAAELETLRATHPEIEQAIQTFENELEVSSMSHAVPVNPDLKSQLFNQLNLETPGSNYEAVDDPKVHKLESGGKTPFIKYLAAASIILFIISAGLNVYTYSKYKKVVGENRQLALQRDQLYAKNSSIQTRFNELGKNMQLISGPDMIKVALSGVPGKENSQAVVYWSKSNKDVYLIANALPQAPKGKQYQLWALLDGKPIDAGVLGDCNSVCKLKNIPNAQAFAITLENEGGSPTPNLEQLYVMGKI
ncbi:anti-sigma factor [Niabella ginsengisoli]|uniref:Anti-sigma factor n=1 Tax=Niabella ginsengisoli TaxID=522298 RepID=A0ABS9SJH0_9BACT|nr:anti-sigma factor [Niabella ginsengisoli]MCH5598527.1 anti-sigma factor [Niabella ginsengisoli]